jgi:amino acid adenylation domain-containing protein
MQSLLATLAALHVKIEVRDGKLHVNAPSGALTPELQKEIGRHRDELIQLLQEVRPAAAPESELPRIVPDPERAHEPFPLNDVQHAYWIGRSGHLELGEVASHIYFEFDCGDLDPVRLGAAFDKVVAMHGMLRAVVDVNGRQRILPAVPAYEIAVLDVRGEDPERRAAELERVRAEMSHQVFSCDRWPLFEIRLIRHAEGRSRLCVSLDFLVLDAWSMLILFRQWYAFYENLDQPVREPGLSFRDYVLAEAGLKETASWQMSKAYWWERLDDLPAAPLLPVVNKLERGRKHYFGRRRLRLPAERWEGIKSRARRSGLTLSSLLLGAFSEVLNRWVRTPHYCLNLTLFNRLPLHEEVPSIIGDFTNLLVLEVDGRAGGSFVERASRLQARFLQDFEHRQVSAIEVLRELAKRRGWQQRALLPVVFTSTLMLDGRRSEDAGAWERFGTMDYGITQTPQVLLDYQIFEISGDLVINWDAVDEAFLPGVLDDMFGAHAELLETLAADPAAWERNEVVVLPAEQQMRRALANGTAAEDPGRRLHELFVERALEAPDRVALISQAGEMSYGDLLAHSHAVAEELLLRGARPNELVAVVLPKGWEQVVAVLGVLLAGAAYLPIDPRWPALRRRGLLEQGEARLALTRGDLEAADEEHGWPAGVERIAVTARPGLEQLTAAPPLRQALTDLAYVIFTSGSTGTPKGVMIDHRAAVNTVVHVNRLFGVGPEDRTLAVSDLTFDLSVWDLFGLLAAGGSIVLPEAELARDPGHWEELIRRCNVTVWNSAPPLMGVLVDAAESAAWALAPLRLVLLSGDWIPVQLPDRIRRLARGARVVSLGGATEGSIWSIYHPVDEIDPLWDSIPYGKALPNQHMYVLSRGLQPSPDLVTGDIYIGGDGVALGYWKDPERTARQFFRHPETGERLYFTGDLGRMRRDGNIEFLGREDSQVKLRGYRVELGEISAALMTHPGVREAVVQLVHEEGRSSLVAWVVAGAAEGLLFERAEVPEAQLRQAAGRVEAAGAERERTADRAALGRFRELWSRIETASLRAILETLQALGLVDGAEVSRRVDELVHEGRVRPPFRRLLGRWLRVLAAGGHLAPRDGGYEVVPTGIAAAEPVERQLAALEAWCGDDASLRGYLDYVASCLRRHLALLSGEVMPVELLFPDGSWRLAEALYEKSPIARHHNGVAAAVVASLVGSWESDRRLRVLEIGAGTGGTTTSVLPVLPPERTEYWFTDLSTYFFQQAREKLGAPGFVRYGLFDIDKPPAAQGHPPHSYDLVLAANVLHNASDLHAALGSIRGLLRPGGYLVLLEGTSNTPWQWATIAFLEAVGSYADERAESDQPLLAADEWRRALDEGGFAEVQAFPSRSVAADGELAGFLQAMPQHVIAARGPAGVSRFRPDELAQFLRERLPGHMVPQRYVLLDRLPLTANGKVDLAALPRENAAPAAEERRVVLPGSETEERILRIWREVLGVEQLSISDNFFEVGGDSLLMTAVLRKLNQTQRPPLTTAELFAYPTVQSLAEYLSPGSKLPKGRPAARLERAAPEAGLGSSDIAVIGLAGRFPDARNVTELWENVAAGHSSVRRFTDAELLEAGVSPEELAQPSYVRAGVVLEGIDQFDASFFGFTPREAEIMDPQQRFLLECAVEALETAGYPNERHAGRIGVFVGKGTSRYFLEHVLPHPEIVQKLGLMTVLNVNEKDFAATLVSYKLNLTGPSLNINTACSTSLVAVHAACRSLLDGDCEIALAGGVSFVSTLERSGYLHHEGQITSPDGLCRAFSDDANGTVFGNGAGLVVLKPLAAALRDRDTIHAVIKGTAINNDGSLKAGYNAPSLHGQAEAISGALARAGVSPDSIQLLEAHGTGTNLGDPIEFGALRKVFGGPRPDGSRCALGSLKTNIGHLDSAAGVAGLIKVVEALKHRQMPPMLHASAPSRKIDFADSPFYLIGELADWPADGAPRRAGVSSFGVGGTNVHAVVEEAPAQAPRPASGGAQLLPLSAKSARSLKKLMRNLADDFGVRPELPFDDVAFTLQAGRNGWKYRSFLICDSLAEARRRLADETALLPVAVQNEGQSTAVTFVFPGQGVRLRDIAELYETCSGFRGGFDECGEILRRYTERDIRDLLYAGQAGSPELDFDQTSVVQPFLFAVEYALARFWDSVGIRPVAMIGHSLGEYVAACLAGVFSLAEVLSLVVVRGQLMQSLEPGRMMAVSCSEEQVRAFLAGTACSLAAVNGPQQCVVSGAAAEIEALQARLAAADVTCRPLRTSHAFHSAAMDPILDTFEQCVAAVERQPPAIPFLSSVTGLWITDEQATSPAYWARHLRETVRFGDGAQELLRLASCVALEVGPGHTLSTLLKVAGAPQERVVPSLGYDAERGGRRAVLEAVGRLWLQGVDVDWERLHEAGRPGRVPLPTYAFERKRYWIEKAGLGRPVAAARPAAEEVPDEEEVSTSYARPDLETAYAAPVHEIETKLAAIWRSYLGIDTIGVKDNFFALGGDSLLATRVHAQIKRDLGVELPMGKMFELSTIKRQYLFIVASSDPEAIDALAEEELNDLLAVMES